MKNLLGVLFIGLLTVSQARADHYVCIGDDRNSELTITTQPINEGQVDSKETATVIFKTAGQSKVFTGAEYELPGYKLLSADGDLAFLKLKTVFTPGGRCGRCTPDFGVKTYAKLTINNEELDFICHSTLSL